MLSIPNYLPSRQGKSLDYVLACLSEKISEKRYIKAVRPINGIPHNPEACKFKASQRLFIKELRTALQIDPNSIKTHKVLKFILENAAD